MLLLIVFLTDVYILRFSLFSRSATLDTIRSKHLLSTAQDSFSKNNPLPLEQNTTMSMGFARMDHSRTQAFTGIEHTTAHSQGTFVTKPSLPTPANSGGSLYFEAATEGKTPSSSYEAVDDRPHDFWDVVGPARPLPSWSDLEGGGRMVWTAVMRPYPTGMRDDDELGDNDSARRSITTIKTEQDERGAPEHRMRLRQCEKEKYLDVWRTDAMYGKDPTIPAVVERVAGYYFPERAIFDVDDGIFRCPQCEYELDQADVCWQCRIELDGVETLQQRLLREADYRLARARFILDLRINFKLPRSACLLSLTVPVRRPDCEDFDINRRCRDRHKLCQSSVELSDAPIIRILCDRYLRPVDVLALSQSCSRLYYVLDVKKIEFRRHPKELKRFDKLLRRDQEHGLNDAPMARS